MKEKGKTIEKKAIQRKTMHKQDRGVKDNKKRIDHAQ